MGQTATEKPKNPVQEAMEILAGGEEPKPEDIAVVCRVTGAAVRKWLEKGRIRDGVYAMAVARATKAKGKEVTLERLLGIAVLPKRRGPTGGPASSGGTSPCSTAARRRRLASVQRGHATAQGALPLVVNG